MIEPRYVSGSPSEKMFKAVLIALVFLLTALHSEGTDEEAAGEGSEMGFVRADLTSFSGTATIEDIDTISIWPEIMPPPSSGLGQYTWIKDLNHDGFDDIAVSAPFATGYYDLYEEGRVYIWYGGEDFEIRDLDLEEKNADLTIIGHTLWTPESQGFGPAKPRSKDRMAREISSGDLNGDGYIDLVLGAECFQDGGMIYVFWGREEGFPDVIEMYGSEKYQNVSYLPRDSMSYYEWEGEVYHYSQEAAFDVKRGTAILIEDLDADGIDDLMYSAPAGQSVYIYWGSDNFTQRPLPTEIAYKYNDPYLQWNRPVTTIRMDGDSGLGQSLEIGDIDGDGKRDLVIGSPRYENLELGRMEVGAVYLLFNISRLNRSTAYSLDDIADSIIYGTNENDNLGWDVELYDMNHDGKDDIFIGVPGADSILENKENCGEVLVFMGNDPDTFPHRSNGENNCSKIILGDEGADYGPPKSYGDKLGRMIALSDLNGDGMIELLNGVPQKNPTDMSDPNRIHVGALMIYDLKTIIGSSNKIHQLGYPADFFTIEGNQMEDSFGYSYSIGDINGDGAQEILVGAPWGDGPSEERKNCGEAYLLIGSKITMGDASFYGIGSDEESIYAGSGQVDLNISFRHSLDARTFREGRVEIDPGGLDLAISFNGDSIQMEGGESSDIRLLGSSDMGADFLDGWMTPSFEFGWFCPLEGPVDVKAGVKDDNGNWIYRYYRNLLHVRKDIGFEGEIDVRLDGESMLARWQWCSPGQTMSVTGPRVTYLNSNGREIPGAVAEVALLQEQVEEERTGSNMDSWHLDSVIPDAKMVHYNLSIVPDLPTLTDTVDPLNRPDVGPDIEFDLRIDNNPPDPPTQLQASTAIAPGEGYRVDVGWAEEVGSRLDPESGVRTFQSSVQGGPFDDVTERGGLWGTYYRDENMEDIGFERRDGSILFNWGIWSPQDDVGEVPVTLPLDGFTIRWHGYFEPNRTGEHIFALNGQGSVRMIVGDEVLFDWIDLDDISVYGHIDLVEKEKVPMKLYYKEQGGTSSIRLRCDDGNGNLLTVGPSSLFFPSNQVRFITLHNPAVVAIRSVDWTGKMSNAVSISALTDDVAPNFMTEDVPPWYGAEDIVVMVNLTDPDSHGEKGSGIDPETVRYSIKGPKGLDTDWMERGLSLKEEKEGYTVLTTLGLNNGWTGSIRWMAEDRAGNVGISAEVPIGIDMDGPDLEILSPVPGEVISGYEVNLMVRVSDRGGSGVAAGSCHLRYRIVDRMWEEWMDLGPDDGSEAVTIEETLILPPGELEVQIRGSDNVGNEGYSSIFHLTLQEPEMDLPPVPFIMSPKNGSYYNVGWPVLLDGEGTTDDGKGASPHLIYSWFSSIDGYLGGEKRLMVDLSEGSHRIWLHVFDGTPGNNVSTYVDIMIIPVNGTVPPGENDNDENDGKGLAMGIILGIAFLLAAVILIFALSRRYRKDTIYPTMDSMDDLIGGPEEDDEGAE